jgi:hypothetical protein
VVLLGGIKKAIDQLYPKRTTRRKLKRQLLAKESAIGKALFGSVPKGHRRDFYVLDAQTIIWNEAWRDNRNKERMTRTRYEIYPNKIVKAQDGQPPRFISKEEATQLLTAMRWYRYLVGKNIYGKFA